MTRSILTSCVVLLSGAALAAPLPYKSELKMTSPTHGYSVFNNLGGSNYPNVPIETKDSGAHWTALPEKAGWMVLLLRDGKPAFFTPPPQEVCPPGQASVKDELRPLWSVVDAKVAWVMGCGDASEGREIRGLWRTEDAGVHWKKVAGTHPRDAAGQLPVSGHKSGMYFRDASHGWVFGSEDAGSVYLFVTSDGGKSWKRQELQIPQNAWIGFRNQPDTLQFISAKDGLLMVNIQLNNEEPVATLYATSDGGGHWKSQGEAPGHHLSFPDLKHGFAAEGERLYSTKDGGKKWSQVSVGLGKIEWIQFVNAESGWLWTCGSSLSQECSLLFTQDGGRRWFVMEPQVAESASAEP